MPDLLVSICIPVFNGEKFLKQCIDSCLAQTYSNYEVIVSDDHSTDGSEQIVRRLMQLEPKIKYYKNETNLGLVANWNRCIGHATGEWIKMLFQDDYMAPDCLSARFWRSSSVRGK